VTAKVSVTVSVTNRSRTGLDRRLVVLAGLVLASLALVWVDPNALCLLPTLVLAVPLLMRCYPGERVLGALRERAESPRRHPRSLAPARWLSVMGVPRGGLLLASSLAVRPPPAVALPAS
jgi:hypothetical protein